MADKVKPIPDGFHTVTPMLTVEGASDAIAFYKRAFGAEEIMRMPSPDGHIMHAQIKIGDSLLMIHDDSPEPGRQGPKAMGGSPMSIYLMVDDVDAFYARAVEAGATASMPIEDMFWGDRFGGLIDPFGYFWGVATHVRDVDEAELKAASAAMAAGDPHSA